MKENDFVGKETKDLLIAADRLSGSLALIEHALDFVESEISSGRKMDKSQIGALITILKSFAQEDEQALLAKENAPAEGGSGE